MVLSSVSYPMGANVENLTLTGAAAIDGTGNDGDNSLTGNSANNTLTGGDGNDTISGNDTIRAGLDNDIVIGMLLAMSGQGISYGKWMSQGALLAADLRTGVQFGNAPRLAPLPAVPRPPAHLEVEYAGLPAVAPGEALPAALTVARANHARIAPPTPVEFRQGDLLWALGGDVVDARHDGGREHADGDGDRPERLAGELHGDGGGRDRRDDRRQRRSKYGAKRPKS